MADIAIFRINYKSDFILTLQSDAGWLTPFCIKFWTGAPSKAYYAYYDGMSYTHCTPVDGEPTKLLVQFDDHHLPIGDLKFQIGYHFTVADFPTSVEDEVINQAAVIINNDGEQQQVMLDFNGETAPEIEFALPAYANEAQRITNEQARIAAEETRQANEQQRINQETARVSEFARLKTESEAATDAAMTAADATVVSARNADEKAAAAQSAATLANEKAQLAEDKAALAQAAATFAQTQGNYAKTVAEEANTVAEAAKTVAEEANMAAEAARTEAEAAHALNEEVRDDEAARDQAEQVRQQQETARQQAEAQRATDFNTQMQQQQTAFQQAESARTTAFNNQLQQQQTAYTDAEAARETAFNEAETERDAKVDEKVADITTLQAQVGYFVCDTAAATAAKTITATGYVLTTGGNIRIKMINANTADAVTLNINNTGAKALFYNGAQASSTNSWEAGEVVEVYYDGTQFQCQASKGGGNLSIIHEIDTTTEYTNKDVAGADAVQAIGKDIYGVKYEYSLSDLTQGYYNGTIGSTVNGNDANWCKRMVFTLKMGQHIKLVTKSRGNAHSYIITDSENIVLYTSGVGSVNKEFDVEDSTWAKMYICCADVGYDVFELSVDEKEGLIPTIEKLVAQSDNYEKAVKYVDYSDQIEEGHAYNVSGGTLVTRTATSGWTFRSVKIKCAKGDIFGIVTGGVTNINPVILCDENNTVLWAVPAGNHAGIFEVNYDNAATLYVSANQDTNIDVVRKLPLKHDDLIEVSSPYLNRSLYSINGVYQAYPGYVGISLPIVLKKGDTVRLKGKSYHNFRAYLLQNMDNTFVTGISDINLSIEGYFTWMGNEDVYLYVNGLASDPPYITKFPKAAATTLKHYGKKIATLGDSITSYDASDIGECVRSHLGMIFLRSGNQIDWGNLAEGNATICNFAETTENFTHSDGTYISGKYVNRTLPNEVLKLLQHTTADGAQITWHIASDNSNHSIDTSVATGTGYTTDIPDVIYIAMGTNDWSTTDDFDAVIAQTYSQLNKLTICSSLRWCLETLQNVYPNAAIICVTPIVRTQRPTAEMKAKCELIKKMCAYMAIPVVDGYHISGFSPLSQLIYSPDYIHPNNYTQRIARSIAAQVDALC